MTYESRPSFITIDAEMEAKVSMSVSRLMNSVVVLVVDDGDCEFAINVMMMMMI